MRGWMVRAGEGAKLISEFISGSKVVIGWSRLGNLDSLTDRSKIEAAVNLSYPEQKKHWRSSSIGMLQRFRNEIAEGDTVISYDPAKREYHIGAVIGKYRYDPENTEYEDKDYVNIRDIKWRGVVPRDKLSVSVRNHLGSIMTLFEVNADALDEFDHFLKGDLNQSTEETQKEVIQEEKSSLREVVDSAKENAREFIKDKLSNLDPNEMEEIIAGLLRAMGYKARVTSRGPDRGRDVIASPDGLGLEEPRIVVEVKHRQNTSMGAPDVRSFLGGLRGTTKGIYVSTGGFTKEARYEAERAQVPVALLDIDGLVDYLLDYYENLEPAYRALLPMVKVYYPVPS